MEHIDSRLGCEVYIDGQGSLNLPIAFAPAAAWEHRAEAPSYVVPRILWLQLALLYISTTETAEMDSAHVILGRLKTALAREGAHAAWKMDRVLAHLQRILPAEQYQLLDVLVAALNDAAELAALEPLCGWHNVQPKPLE